MPLPTIPSGNVASQIPTGYNIDNSCRFNGADSTYLTKTLGTPTDNLKWTFSGWVKRCQTSGDGPIMSIGGNTSSFTRIDFNGSGQIEFDNKVGASYSGRRKTSALHRDHAAWYHIVAVFDSANATGDDRMILYVNGSRITAFATDTDPSSDEVSGNTSSQTVRLGVLDTATYFSGYMAEVCFVDGQALAPTEFGEYDEDSPTIWKPKDISGLTFGNNGFYLDFEDSSNLGNDANGGTDLTEVNLAATDQTTDTPTNNFCTLNSLENYYPSATFAEGNVSCTTGGTNKYAPVPSTFGMTASKWYWEIKPTARSSGSYYLIGILSTQPSGSTNSLGYNANDYAYYSADGKTRNNNSFSGSAYGDTYDTNDIIGIALDLDNNKLYFAKNGTWQNSGDPTSGSTGTGAVSITAASSTTLGAYFAGYTYFDDAASTYIANFGNPSYANSSDAADANGYGKFEYAPPSGYLALCTKNLGSDGG